jgi:hypothetical protein
MLSEQSIHYFNISNFKMAPSPNRTIYALIVRAFTFIIEQFFREINQRGSWQIPEKGIPEHLSVLITNYCNNPQDQLYSL